MLPCRKFRPIAAGRDGNLDATADLAQATLKQKATLWRPCSTNGATIQGGSVFCWVPVFFLRPDRGPSFLLCATFGSARSTFAEPRRIARPRNLSRPPDGLHCCSNQACTQSGSADETPPCAGFPRPIRPGLRRWVRQNGLRAVSHTG